MILKVTLSTKVLLALPHLNPCSSALSTPNNKSAFDLLILTGAAITLNLTISHLQFKQSIQR